MKFIIVKTPHPQAAHLHVYMFHADDGMIVGSVFNCIATLGEEPGDSPSSFRRGFLDDEHAIAWAKKQLSEKYNPSHTPAGSVMNWKPSEFEMRDGSRLITVPDASQLRRM